MEAQNISVRIIVACMCVYWLATCLLTFATESSQELQAGQFQTNFSEFQSLLSHDRLTRTVCIDSYTQIVDKTGSKLKSLQKKKSPSREQIEKEEQVYNHMCNNMCS